MRFEEKTLTLRDGRTLALRSPEAADAKTMLAYLRRVSAETVFLVSGADEIALSVDEERAVLDAALANERKLMLTLFDGERAVGNCSFSPVSPRRKMSHRATLGIAIFREYWGLGLGRLLLREAARLAEAAGYEQLELGVYADNERAIRLYESEGYTVFGRVPRAFRLPDGTYRGELQMVKRI